MKNKILIGLVFALFSSMSFAKVDSNPLDKQIKERLKEIEKYERSIETIKAKNCQGFEEQDEVKKEESDGAVILKNNLVVENNGKEIELVPNDKIKFLSRALRKNGDEKVRIQYFIANDEKKGRGYITVKNLKQLLEDDNTIPKDCLK